MMMLKGLVDQLSIRSRHPCGEAERASRRGRSGNDPCTAGEREARRQCPVGDRPGVRSQCAAGCQRGRIGHIQISTGQGCRGDGKRRLHRCDLYLRAGIMPNPQDTSSGILNVQPA